MSKSHHTKSVHAERHAREKRQKHRMVEVQRLVARMKDLQEARSRR